MREVVYNIEGLTIVLKLAKINELLLSNAKITNTLHLNIKIE